MKERNVRSRLAGECFRRRERRRASGFTLIELLVVIGIIALLISILLPVLASARSQSRSVVCQSNLRQWATAVLSYTNENDGLLPRRGQGVQMVSVVNRPSDWFNALPPLLKQMSYIDRFNAGNPPLPGDGSVWSCPEFVIKQTNPHQFGYAMNMKLSTWNALMPDKINRVGPTTSLVFMADAPGAYASVLPSALGEYNPVARHRGRVNIAFLDTHVASFKAAEVGIGKGEGDRSDIIWKPKYTTWSPN